MTELISPDNMSVLNSVVMRRVRENKLQSSQDFALDSGEQIKPRTLSYNEYLLHMLEKNESKKKKKKLKMGTKGWCHLFSSTRILTLWFHL